MEPDFEEAIHLQVLLKAEQAGILCSDENLPALVKMAKSIGAPYKAWEFTTQDGMIRAVPKHHVM